MTDYAKYLIPCEQRSVKEAAAKEAASESWRRSNPLNPPVDHQRIIPTRARMGLRAKA